MKNVRIRRRVGTGPTLRAREAETRKQKSSQIETDTQRWKRKEWSQRAHRQINRETNKQIDKQTFKQTHKQADKTNRQT